MEARARSTAPSAGGEGLPPGPSSASGNCSVASGLEERQPRRRPTQGTISLAGATSSRPRRATGRRRAKCGGLSDHWDEAPYPPRGSLLTGPPHTDPWTFLSPPSATQGYRSTPSYCGQRRPVTRCSSVTNAYDPCLSKQRGLCQSRSGGPQHSSKRHKKKRDKTRQTRQKKQNETKKLAVVTTCHKDKGHPPPPTV